MKTLLSWLPLGDLRFWPDMFGYYPLVELMILLVLATVCYLLFSRPEKHDQRSRRLLRVSKRR